MPCPAETQDGTQVCDTRHNGSNTRTRSDSRSVSAGNQGHAITTTKLTQRSHLTGAEVPTTDNLPTPKHSLRGDLNSQYMQPLNSNEPMQYYQPFPLYPYHGPYVPYPCHPGFQLPHWPYNPWVPPPHPLYNLPATPVTPPPATCHPPRRCNNQMQQQLKRKAQKMQ